jgi:hypothetical protein
MITKVCLIFGQPISEQDDHPLTNFYFIPKQLRLVEERIPNLLLLSSFLP